MTHNEHKKANNLLCNHFTGNERFSTVGEWVNAINLDLQNLGLRTDWSGIETLTYMRLRGTFPLWIDDASVETRPIECSLVVSWYKHDDIPNPYEVIAYIS
jgi:hypothetical protein